MYLKDHFMKFFLTKNLHKKNQTETEKKPGEIYGTAIFDKIGLFFVVKSFTKH